MIEVTNRNEAGPGSLRACIRRTGPRICVFRVGGTIRLESGLEIREPRLTVAGQTAPGDGITIAGNGIEIFANEVVIRYLRVRRGPGGAGDAIWVRNGASNVIVDHCSMSWGVDENLSATEGARNITFQWNIISEGLARSTHPEGSHSMGSLISDAHVTIHHNLFAHNDLRHPRVSAPAEVEFINNVVYNWRTMATQLSSSSDATPEDHGFLNVVNNYYKTGPNYTGAYEIELRKGEAAPSPESRIYVRGNIGPHRPRGRGDQWSLVTGGTADQRSGSPVATVSRVRQQPAVSAFELVLSRAGATRPRRDSVDRRIVSEVRRSKGQIIDDPSQVGGLPALRSARPPVDSDHDGMPNPWERSHGLNPTNPRDGARIAANGYSNVENYLNELAGDPIPRRRALAPIAYLLSFQLWMR